MLRVTVLGSGSRGNAFLVESEDTCVLIDAGFGVRSLAKRLAMAGKRPDDVQALLLTHEHSDHASGAAAACNRWNWPLYATAGTLSNLPDAPLLANASLFAVRLNCSFNVDGIAVVATPVPHDANEAAALVLTDIKTGCRVGIATDLGHVPDSLPQHFERLDVLVVESNHDEQMLMTGPYPWMLKRRVGSNLGHLSNRQASAFAAQCSHKGLRAVVLAHLSETNNTPEIAVLAAATALKKAGWRGDVWAAHQRELRGPYATREHGVSAGAVQLGLGF